jgi:hypothetical protein
VLRRQKGQILLPLPNCINTVACSNLATGKYQMPSFKSTEDDVSRLGLASSSAFWLQTARQARFSLEAQSALLKNYDAVFNSWLQRRQQDVAEGLRTCEEIAENPDPSSAITAYQKWSSACINRWAEDYQVLRDNIMGNLNQVLEISKEAAAANEAGQDTNRPQAVYRSSR